ncbi:MAG: hypothetical protein AB7G06_09485 [Bdellovibrionales bacterium]
MLSLLIRTLILILVAGTRWWQLTGAGMKAFDANPQHTFRALWDRNGIENLEVGIKTTTRVRLTVAPEYWYHRALKFVGLATECRTGVRDIDDAFFISADNIDAMQTVMQSPELHQLLNDLFSLPVIALQVTPTRIWCKLDEEATPKRVSVLNYKDRINESYTNYRQQLELLQKISDHLNKADFVATSSAKVRAIAFMCAHAGLIAFGLAGIANVLAPESILNFRAYLTYTGILIIAFIILWLPLIKVSLRGSGWQAMVLGDFALFGILGIVLASPVIVYEVNVRADWHQPALREQTVVKRICKLSCRSPGKYVRSEEYKFDKPSQCTPAARAQIVREKKAVSYPCRSYADFNFFIATTRWDTDKKIYRFMTTKELFDSTKVGSTLQIPVYPGVLGLPWVDRSEITQAAD